jgi:hypothetical protein
VRSTGSTGEHEFLLFLEAFGTIEAREVRWRSFFLDCRAPKK